MFLKFLLASALVAALWFLCWWLRGVMVTPVKPGQNERLQLTVFVSGAAPTLEQTVDAILWLRANGTLPVELLIADAGMDAETAKIAAALARNGVIKIID